MIATGTVAKSPLVDALTGGPIPEASLTLPPGHLLLGPVSGVLDNLSLLTDRQHLGVLAGAAVAFAAWRLSRGFARGRVRWLRELGLAAGALTALLAFYSFGVLGKRPMASLETHHPDVVVVDFHGHTEGSHDGRPGLDVESRREWNRSAGFHVGYVTDHRTVHHALIGASANPERAGDGTSLLPGREVVFRDQHVLVLGTTDPTSEHALTWPVLIQTLPNDLGRVPVPWHGEVGGVIGIELVDAAPRGLRQGVEERERILAIADSLGLVPVAGSNHHGWGRTAAAWNLFRIPGWRALPPHAVGAEIEARLRAAGDHAPTVVARRRIGPESGPETALLEALALPRVAWHILITLTPLERAAWVAWLAAAAALLSRVPAPSRAGREQSGRAALGYLQDGGALQDGTASS